MKYGAIRNATYTLRDPALAFRGQGVWRYVFSDLLELQFHRGSHYEISFISSADFRVVSARMNSEFEERAWCQSIGDLGCEFGWTWNHLSSVVLKIAERSARRLVARTGGLLTGISIYSPEFLAPQQQLILVTPEHSLPLGEGAGMGVRR